MVIKTQLEWTYDPPDYFEAPLTVPFATGELEIVDGHATFTLAVPANPLPADVRTRLTDQLQQVFSVRRVATHRASTLTGPRVIQHEHDGRRTVSVSLSGVSARLSSGKADVVVTAADGTVKYDSRKHRVAEENAIICDLAPKAVHSGTLRRMGDSYGRAVTDPANELIHLYEVRDAASKHYGGEAATLAALGISKNDWKELGRLANDAPIAAGRHRGRHLTGLRSATAVELAFARRTARTILEERFAKTLSVSGA